MDELSKRARRLAVALEPVAGQVYFSPEAHANYERLGFGPSPGDFAGVPAPEMASYFTSRGSVMGQVPGELVAAAFGVFNPKTVIKGVNHGWSLTNAQAICTARDEGAIAQLTRIVGTQPEGVERANALLAHATEELRLEGRPLYSGMASLDLPDEPIGSAWRRADMLREYRGDSHVNAWTTAGFSACEICLLTEPFWGLPLRSYSRTRGWTDADFDLATEHLMGNGWLSKDGLTDEGWTVREGIERDTDVQCQPFIEALDEDLDELVAILSRWSTAIREAKGYPTTGPQELANAVTRS